MNLKVGDTVRYLESLKYRDEFSEHTVLDLLPEGIPSCPEPMVKLSGKAGYVLASHCFVISEVVRKKGGSQ